ncbi:hypothetical protein DL764_002824 [Monosporascus ibericus]|uniref:Uncharacterized protein n=1 Tax=Monosporascus ibericus TaxID=155417 RepID=A0A4Q4TJ08_9PEZI|nr:hypothetical protein DL764_002824 [Monosporascus ibericus]
MVPYQPTWRHEMQGTYEMRHISDGRGTETTTQRVAGRGNPGAAVQGGFEDTSASSIASVETSAVVQADRRAGIAAVKQGGASAIRRTAGIADTEADGEADAAFSGETTTSSRFLSSFLRNGLPGARSRNGSFEKTVRKELHLQYHKSRPTHPRRPWHISQKPIGLHPSVLSEASDLAASHPPTRHPQPALEVLHLLIFPPERLDIDPEADPLKPLHALPGIVHKPPQATA